MTLPLTPAQVDALVAMTGSVLPQTASDFEKALTAAMLHHGLDVPIGDLWNPDRCPAPLLPYLAWALSVDFWVEEWPEHKKRRVIAESVELHRLKGTLEGARRYVALADAELVRAIVPPDTFFASDNMDIETRLAYLERLPEIRIFTEPAVGDAGFGFFPGTGTGVSAFLQDDDGAANIPVENVAPGLMGRRAKLYDNDTITPLIIDDCRDEFGRIIPGAERYLIPGNGEGGCFPDAGPAFMLYFTEPAHKARIVTVSKGAETLDKWERLLPVRDGLSPVTVVPKKTFLPSTAPCTFFAGLIPDELFFVHEDVSRYIYESLRLHDPEKDVLAGNAITFLSDVRLGQAAHTATLEIGIIEPGDPYAFGEFVWGYLAQSSNDKLNRVLEAVEAASSAHEQILVDTEVYRPPVLGGDLFIGAFRLGQPVRG